MTDDEVAQMGESMRREEESGMVLVMICLVAIASSAIGCSLMWLVQKLMGIV